MGRFHTLTHRFPFLQFFWHHHPLFLEENEEVFFLCVCLLSDDVIHFFTKNKNAPPPRAPTPNSRPRPFTTPPHAFLNIGMFSDLARYVWSQPFQHFELIYGFYGSFYTINIPMNNAKITCLIISVIPLLAFHVLAPFYFAENALYHLASAPNWSHVTFSVKGVIFKTHMHPVDLFQMFHKF